MVDVRAERASILLVDDAPAYLVALRAMLDGLGLDLVEARSGEEALDRIAAPPFAARLLAVPPPGPRGFATRPRLSWRPPRASVEARSSGAMPGVPSTSSKGR